MVQLTEEVKAEQIRKLEVFKSYKSVLSDTLVLFTEVIRDLLPNNRFDFYDLSPNNYFLILEFKHLRVTNSLEQEIHLDDVLFGIHFSSEGIKLLYYQLGDFTGLGGYTFSHANGSSRSIYEVGDPGNWSSLCLGTAAIQNYLNNLNRDLTLDSVPNSQDVYLLVASIPEYLSWESLEGGPYRKMGEYLKIINPKIEPTYSAKKYLQKELEQLGIEITFTLTPGNNEPEMRVSNMETLKPLWESRVIEVIKTYQGELPLKLFYGTMEVGNIGNPQYSENYEDCQSMLNVVTHTAETSERTVIKVHSETFLGGPLVSYKQKSPRGYSVLDSKNSNTLVRLPQASAYIDYYIKLINTYANIYARAKTTCSFNDSR